METERDNSVPRRGWPRLQTVVEHQPIPTDGVSKVTGRKSLRQQVDEFAIMRSRKHGVRLGTSGTGDKLAQDRLAGGDRPRFPREPY